MQAARYRWLQTARPEQVTPAGDWATWLILAGRGWGKTRTGAEDVADYARTHPGARIALVAATFADGRDTMVEGESGLLAILPDQGLRGGNQDAAWNRSLGELYLDNGSRFKIYSSEKPRQLRGPQHDRAWCDELAAWRDAHLGDVDDTTWSNLQLGLRLGSDPRCVVTTTPKPNRLVRDLAGRDDVHITRGSTYDNLDNLAPTFRRKVLDRYEGTRLGRQELLAELLEDVEGAYWTSALIEKGRVEDRPDLVRVVVAVDPAVTASDESDETGIVIAGVGVDGHCYVLADRTCRLSPSGWAKRAIQAYDDFEADRIVAEVNNGGDLVVSNIQAVRSTVKVDKVSASRGKQIRAAPIASLYGDPENLDESEPRVHHVGQLPELEDQLTTWTPESGESPDRLDALVWAVTELMLGQDRAWGFA